MDNQNTNQTQPVEIQPTKPQKMNIKPWWIIVGVVAILGLYLLGTYNGLAKENQNVEASWSQVENQMQRRYDLIPNLVNSVKGSMKQEKDIFLSIADARKEYGGATTAKEKIDANAKVQSSVGTLFSVIQENYPELKSSNNVDRLMNELAGTENRIMVARKRYNESVKVYNRSVVTFPKSAIANMMGLGQKPYFKAVDGADQTPKVDLTN